MIISYDIIVICLKKRELRHRFLPTTQAVCGARVITFTNLRNIVI